MLELAVFTDGRDLRVPYIKKRPVLLIPASKGGLHFMKVVAFR